MIYEECNLCSELISSNDVMDHLQKFHANSASPSTTFKPPPSPYDLINKAAKKCKRLTYFPQSDNWSCGYRNLMIILSSFDIYLDIDALQSIIEKAWLEGWDPKGYAELGKLRHTRTKIGTPEVYTCLSFLGISTVIYDFTKAAICGHSDLKVVVEKHFEAEQPYPLYLQYDGHSQTIVGIYKSSLLLFDPANTKPVPYPMPFSRLSRPQYQIVRSLGQFKSDYDREATKEMSSITHP